MQIDDGRLEYFTCFVVCRAVIYLPLLLKMPSFSTLLKRSKRVSAPNHDAASSPNEGASANNGTNEKVQRRKSTRDFFRNLLSPTSSRSESRTSQRHSDQVKVQSIGTNTV